MMSRLCGAVAHGAVVYSATPRSMAPHSCIWAHVTSVAVGAALLSTAWHNGVQRHAEWRDKKELVL
jgi:hypothetical protein